MTLFDWVLKAPRSTSPANNRAVVQRTRRILKVTADNRVIQEYSIQEAEKAAEVYSSSLPLKFS